MTESVVEGGLEEVGEGEQGGQVAGDLDALEVPHLQRANSLLLLLLLLFIIFLLLSCL